MWLYKGRTCFVVTFSLPLSLPFDWTFKIWSMCLLFSFVCFEWMLCCDVVCEKKLQNVDKESEESLDCLILHVAWLHLMVSKSLPLSLKYPFCCLRSWNVLMRPPCCASACFDHHWQSYTRCSWMLLDHVYTVINSWVLWMEDAKASQMINYPMRSTACTLWLQMSADRSRAAQLPINATYSQLYFHKRQGLSHNNGSESVVQSQT